MTYRNPKLLAIAKQSPCQLCGVQDSTIVASHSNQLIDGKGMGIKASDYRIAYLCNACHYTLDQGKQLPKAKRKEYWDQAHRSTIGWLFENGYLEVNEKPKN
jgi:hypothetical protein